MDFLGNTYKDITMDNQQATDLEFGWLAGIIDGEGYLGFSTCNSKGYFVITPHMHICNTDEAIVLRAQEILNKLNISTYVRHSNPNLYQNVRYSNCKISYRVQVKRLKHMQKLMTVIIPHLTGIKQERGKMILEFCNSRISKITGNNGKINPYSERELELFESCKAKQKAGASETIRKAQLEQSKIHAIQKLRDKEVYTERHDRFCAYCKKVLKHGQDKFCSRSCQWSSMRKANCKDIVRPAMKIVG
jgi:hypothetical protein